MNYCGGFGEKLPKRCKWHRDFEVDASISLEILNIIIQKILNWDDTHLYIFKVRGMNYANFGFDDDLVVEDFGDEKYVSCAMPIQKLNLKQDEEFVYNYDFGDNHFFKLKILGINKIAKNDHLPSLQSFQGKNLIQYPDFELDSHIQFDRLTPCNMLHKKIQFWDYTKIYKWRIRFIQDKDYNVLQKWRKSRDKKKWEKAVVVLESWNLSLEKISKKIECPIKEKIKKWIIAFNWYGLEGLEEKGKKKSRRSDARERSELKRKRILEILHQKPGLFGVNRSNWSQPTLSAVYEKKYGEKIAESTVGHLIRKSGYTWKKAKKVLTSPALDYREKVDLLLKTLQSLKKDELFFFVDELGPCQVKKYGGRCYLEKKEILRVPKNLVSKGSVTLFGAVSVTTNQMTWCYGKAKDTSSMIDLIEILFNQYHSTTKLYISWDAASWHSSNELTEWLDVFNAQTREIGMGPIIDLIPLPNCSQFLNVIEAIFSGMKRAVIHHSDYQSGEEMKMAISKHFCKRNEYFKENPKRAGNKIWDINFFKDYNDIKSGNYREY